MREQVRHEGGQRCRRAMGGTPIQLSGHLFASAPTAAHHRSVEPGRARAGTASTTPPCCGTARCTAPSPACAHRSHSALSCACFLGARAAPAVRRPRVTCTCRTQQPAAQFGSGGLPGYRLQAEAGLRRCRPGRRAQLHQGPRPALPDRHRLHPARRSRCGRGPAEELGRLGQGCRSLIAEAVTLTTRTECRPALRRLSRSGPRLTPSHYRQRDHSP